MLNGKIKVENKIKKHTHKTKEEKKINRNLKNKLFQVLLIKK